MLHFAFVCMFSNHSLEHMMGDYYTLFPPLLCSFFLWMKKIAIAKAEAIKNARIVIRMYIGSLFASSGIKQLAVGPVEINKGIRMVNQVFV